MSVALGFTTCNLANGNGEVCIVTNHVQALCDGNRAVGQMETVYVVLSGGLMYEVEGSVAKFRRALAESMGSTLVDRGEVR